MHSAFITDAKELSSAGGPRFEILQTRVWLDSALSVSAAEILLQMRRKEVLGLCQRCKMWMGTVFAQCWWVHVCTKKRKHIYVCCSKQAYFNIHVIYALSVITAIPWFDTQGIWKWSELPGFLPRTSLHFWWITRTKLPHTSNWVGIMNIEWSRVN